MTRPAVLLPCALVSFAANSLAIRYEIGSGRIDPGMFAAIRFVAGATMLTAIALVRREKLVVDRSNLRPALWLGFYGLAISYGYRYIGAAPGTFVFYATVVVTLVAYELFHGATVPAARGGGAAVALGGIATLSWGTVGQVRVGGVVLLAAAGAAWALYTAAGQGVVNARSATTGHFAVVASIGAPLAALGAAAGTRMTVDAVVCAAVVGAVTTATAYVAWFLCQPSMTGTTAASVQLVVPLITAAGAVMFLGEHPSTTLLSAASFVGAGMWLARPRPVGVGNDDDHRHP